MALPGNHEMRHAVGQMHHDDGGQRLGFGQEHMVGRHHDLFRVQAELHGSFFDSVDRGAVHIGLACLAQPPVAYVDSEAFEKTLERGGTAVHRRGLDNFGNQETAASAHGGPRPARLLRSLSCLRHSQRFRRGDKPAGGAQRQRGR